MQVADTAIFAESVEAEVQPVLDEETTTPAEASEEAEAVESEDYEDVEGADSDDDDASVEDDQSATFKIELDFDFDFDFDFDITIEEINFVSAEDVVDPMQDALVLKQTESISFDSSRE